jgi:hypothetical protein
MRDWVYVKFLESFPLYTTGSSFLPADHLALIGLVTKPIVLGPGQSIWDLTFNERLESGVDWKETAKHSAVITGIGKKES